ncbi:MAG: DNA cytosine methyltransferase [Burkholderiales bacterium]|nr:DNA cytosine methyltransferase [Burkholderiales bacterium]
MKRDACTFELDLGHELIIDNFAGGGGTSTGLEAAFGRPVDIAINHDLEALAMHAINHPHTKHLCESVWDVDPIKVTNNQPVAVVWLSPDCKHFSKAKGGTPVDKNIRGLAWVGLRWGYMTKPRVILLENVEEFRSWGPLKVGADGKMYPDPEFKGRIFEAFKAALSTGIPTDHPDLEEICEVLGDSVPRSALIKGLGYVVEFRELKACDYGAPTIRKRLIMIARRDGLPISWPDATHGDPDCPEVLAGHRLPWPAASQCIDFALPAESIFGRKRPLVHNTLRRVAKGLWRHVLTNPRPFIIGAGGPAYSGKPTSLDKPFGTLTTENHRAIVQPILTPFIGEHANSSNQRNMPVDAPLRTICAQVKGGHFSVVAPTLAPLRGTSEAHLAGDDVRAPLSTVSAGGTHHALIGANLVTIGYGERDGQDARAQDIRNPLGTVVTANKHAVVMACLEQANGGFYEGDGRAANAPMSTITATGSNQRLITAYCIKYYSNGGQWQELSVPMHTLPTKARMGLVHVVQVSAEALEPHWRERAKQCAHLLREHLPEHFQEEADLVMVDGWVLVDITLRMLKPRELYSAQGFPKDYVIDVIPVPGLLFENGQQVGNPLDLPLIELSAAAQVRMCGNSVCPPLAEAVINANFAHERRIAYFAA